MGVLWNVNYIHEPLPYVQLRIPVFVRLSVWSCIWLSHGLLFCFLDCVSPILSLHS